MAVGVGHGCFVAAVLRELVGAMRVGREGHAGGRLDARLVSVETGLPHVPFGRSGAHAVRKQIERLTVVHHRRVCGLGRQAVERLGHDQRRLELHRLPGRQGGERSARHQHGVVLGVGWVVGVNPDQRGDG